MSQSIEEMDIKNKYVTEAKEIYYRLNDYEHNNDKYYNALFLRITYCLDDLEKMDLQLTYANFLFCITEIDMIYECVHTIVDDLAKGSWIETENMIYFKFVRDFMVHPDGIHSKKYKNNPVYSGFCSEKNKRIVCRDIMPTDKCKAVALCSIGNNEINTYLFKNEKYEFYFVMVVDYGFPKFKNVRCPYEKIWNALVDILNLLHEVYVSKANKQNDIVDSEYMEN